MAMIAPMAVAGMMAGRNKAIADYLESYLEKQRDDFIRQIKGYLRSCDFRLSELNLRYALSSIIPESVEGDILIEQLRNSELNEIKRLGKYLAEQINNKNNTVEKRIKIQKTVWYAKLSTKQKILSKIGVLKQPNPTEVSHD